MRISGLSEISGTCNFLNLLHGESEILNNLYFSTAKFKNKIS
jgi:hypothetical protein